MDVNNLFPSKYLKAADLQGAQPTVTIANVTMEDIGDDGEKPVIHFDGKEKGVVLNKTNATNISSAYGGNTDGWRGKKVVLFTTWVDFQGKSVEAIRIRPAPAYASGLADHGNVAQQRDEQANQGNGGAGVGFSRDMDDEIPFAPEFR